MDKKMFAQLMKGAKQMADHAAGKKVRTKKEIEWQIKEEHAEKPLLRTPKDALWFAFLPATRQA